MALLSRRDLVQTGLVGAAVGLAGCSKQRPSSPTGAATADTSPSARQAAGRSATALGENLEIVRGNFASKYRRGATTAYVVHYPPGHKHGDRLPVLVCLHGTDEDENAPTVMGWSTASVVIGREGLPPFAIAAIGGGGGSFWRPRADGTDTGAMVMNEFLPILAGLGLAVGRIALHGFSMGGMGAIWLASQAARGTVASLTLTSTPFPRSWDEIKGAYDSAADFEAHDGRALWQRLDGMGLRVDIGWKDPFLDQNFAFIPQAPHQPDLHVVSGGHDPEFRHRIAVDQLRFVAHNFG